MHSILPWILQELHELQKGITALHFLDLLQFLQFLQSP